MCSNCSNRFLKMSNNFCANAQLGGNETAKRLPEAPEAPEAPERYWADTIDPSLGSPFPLFNVNRQYKL